MAKTPVAILSTTRSVRALLSHRSDQTLYQMTLIVISLADYGGFSSSQTPVWELESLSPLIINLYAWKISVIYPDYLGYLSLVWKKSQTLVTPGGLTRGQACQAKAAAAPASARRPTRISQGGAP